MKTFLVRGVPMAMQRDGWWINDTQAAKNTTVVRDSTAPHLWHLGILAVLILLGDVLVWQVAPGVSLALFGAAVMTAALYVAGRNVSKRSLELVMGGSILVLLPLVELVQPLSILIAVLGLSALLVVLAGASAHSVLRGMLQLWPLGIRQGFIDSSKALEAPDMNDAPQMIRRFGHSWILPIGLGFVFVVLLLSANPIADQWVMDMTRLDVPLPSGQRVMFWICLLPLMWTVLCLPRLRERLRATPKAGKIGPKPMGLVNAGSTVRALVLFNIVFAVQTLLDIIYLYGSADLPDGITYAEYAHRGAYPLVFTALLAGGFALLTRRWTVGDQFLRGLLLLFVAQNIVLVISSLFRLELYIEVYGLTHLRLAAAIWMVLVAVGLALIVWQVWKGLGNQWMLVRIGGLGVSVLYVCAFVSFDAAIAGYNLNHVTERDTYFICQLGDAAQPIIVAHEQAKGRPICGRRHVVHAPDDWREWGFRNARARNSLSVLQSKAPL